MSASTRTTVDNKARARAFWTTLFNAHDLELVEDFFAPGFINHNARPGTPAGTQGARETFTRLWNSSSDMQFELQTTIAEADKVVCIGIMRGTHDGLLHGIPATYRSTATRHIHVLTFNHDGLITEHLAARDDLTLLRQLGALLQERSRAQPPQLAPIRQYHCIQDSIHGSKEHPIAHSPKAAGRSDPALAYYEGGPDLSGVVLEALRAASRTVDPLDPDDLAGLDEFHGLGRAATLTMAELARISEGERVLDVGAGIGGPARTLAVHLGARVTALDPTRRFCDLNEELCHRSRLNDKVEVVCGDARELPIDDGEFDVVWTQAVWPNVDDKEAMLSEMHRVLKPDGRLALYEVVSGTAGGDPHYPVPWANGPEQSFLISALELRRLNESAGFAAREWLEPPDLITRIGEIVGSGHPGIVTGVEGITLALVMPDYNARTAALARNVQEQRVGMVMAVFSRT